MEKLSIPLDRFSTILNRINDALPLLYELDGFVDLITRSSFCALKEEKREHYDLTQDIINILITKVSLSITLIEGIKNPLSILNSFKTDLKKFIVTPINFVMKLLDPIFAVMKALDFLKTIASFKIPIPTFSLEWYGFIPYPSFGTKDVGLELIGDIIKVIIDWIKSIPLIGELVVFVENAVDLVLSSIFKAIGVELPEFGLDLPFIEELKKKIEEVSRLSDELIDYFANIMDLDGKFNGLLEPILDPIYNSIPSIDLGCEDNQNQNLMECVFEKVGMHITFIDDLPKLDVLGIDFMPNLALKKIIVDILGNSKDFTDKLDNLFNEEIECRQYETVPLNIISEIATGLNISTSDLPIPNCPINFEMCTDLYLPGADAISTFIKGELTRRKRRLNDICSLTWPNTDITYDFSVSIDVPIKLVHENIPLVRNSLPSPRNIGFKNKDEDFSLHLTARTPESLNFKVGCSEGALEIRLRTDPLISYGLSKTHDLVPTEYAKKALDYLTLNSSKEEMKKFKEEMKSLDILNEILCHLDFLYVNRQIDILFVYRGKDFKLYTKWLDLYEKEIKTLNSKVPKETIKEIVRDLNGPKWTNTGRGWSSTINALRKAQKEANSFRIFYKKLEASKYRYKETMIGVYDLNKLHKYYDRFPKDTYLRQEECAALYGYEVGVPKAFKKLVVSVSEMILKSITFTPFAYTSGQVFPLTSNLRSYNSLGFVNSVQAFDPATFFTSLLVNKGYQSIFLVQKFLEAEEKLKNFKKSELSPSSIPSLEPSNPTPTAVTLPTTSPSPTEEKAINILQKERDQALVNMLVKIFPPIEVGPFYESIKRYMASKNSNTLHIERKHSVFDWITSPIGTSEEVFAEQKQTNIDLGSHFSLSFNLLKDEETQGWDKESKGGKHCSGPVCIFLYRKYWY